MIRLSLVRSPILISILPFGNTTNFDKPANSIINPLDDKFGWDRVKNIFRLNQEGKYTKELTSIINITLSGGMFGMVLGGVTASKNTVDNFISNNEATKFISHFDAKWHLQQAVVTNFIRKGSRMGGKLALFCCIFSTVTTCTSAYRGKIAVENYMLGASITGLLFKINLGLRAALIGMGLGSILGGIYGVTSLVILQISGVTMDEVLEAQKQWINSRDETIDKKIKEGMSTELSEVRQLYEDIKKSHLIEQTENIEDKT
ncbi:RPII140-upstream gene protein [Camponotus floridanus]|uniref:Complex I assembly factor TIMMDC1, mitochondrial n=1 Tax=Camponotus floridanus TaxID=104421 RepID=E1ZUV3_CAMFO|nr:RPII140-upstream gene protein [Camponotus floridanus]EFN75045.1 RPII140-upstream gene protein [Camponotus floridanus]